MKSYDYYKRFNPLFIGAHLLTGNPTRSPSTFPCQCFNPLFIGAHLLTSYDYYKQNKEEFQSPLHRGTSSDATSVPRPRSGRSAGFQSPLHRGTSSDFCAPVEVRNAAYEFQSPL